MNEEGGQDDSGGNAGDAAPEQVVSRAGIRRMDPWAHRRGEPRVFALAWTIFLFAATITTFVAAQRAGIGDRALVRAAARMLVFASAAGVTVLWPMVRLSQWPDPRPVGGTARDLLVMLAPVQAMIWPQAMWWLARWPVPVVASVDALLVAWGVLVGGVLACAQACRLRRMYRSGLDQGAMSSAARGGVGWMVVFIALACAGSLATVGSGEPFGGGDVSPPDVRPSWMLSPLSGVFELTRDRTWSGAVAEVSPGHWGALALIAASGLPAWFVAWGLGRGMKAVSGLH
jgi:hypothetical protein